MTKFTPSGSRPIPSVGFEQLSWWFMRVSGIVLLFLALGHLTIMHLINTVDTIDYAFVAKRYATPFWRTYDGLMLVLALVHGFNGLRIILDDFLKGGKRLLAHSILAILFLAFLLLGLYPVFTFQP
jgi:succinate dehydrogenase / fumarate reductase membrane anchor subunit